MSVGMDPDAAALAFVDSVLSGGQINGKEILFTKRVAPSQVVKSVAMTLEKLNPVPIKIVGRTHCEPIR